MKEKKNGIIQAVVGLIILIIGIVLCVNTYVVKGNKAYAFSLLAAIIGAVVLISGICSMFSTKKIMFLYSENSIKYCKYSKIAHVIVFDKSEIFKNYFIIIKI